jgi:hypothetical protein
MLGDGATRPMLINRASLKFLVVTPKAHYSAPSVFRTCCPHLLFPNLLFPNLLFPNLLFPNLLFPNLLFPNLLFPNLLFPSLLFPNLLFSPNVLQLMFSS